MKKEISRFPGMIKSFVGLEGLVKVLAILHKKFK